LGSYSRWWQLCSVANTLIQAGRHSSSPLQCGTLSFVETAKATSQKWCFRNNNIKRLKTNLYAFTKDGESLADGNMVVFDKAYVKALMQ
jgi:hypothetical protein